MTVVFKYEERIDHYGTTLWCEQYASKPSFVKLWRWGVDDKIGGETLHSKPNMNRLMKTYLADGEIEVKVVRYKDVHSAFNSKGDVKEYIINNNLNESYRPQHNDDIETIELYIYDKSTLDKLFNEYNDYTVLVNKHSMNIRDGKYRDVDNFVEYDVNSEEFEFAVRRLESAYSSIVAKINHYDKTIMIYSIRLRWPTFESANSKRLNESFEDIVKEVANYVLSNNNVNGNTSIMTIDRFIRDAYFELYGEEMESDNKSLYRAIRDEIMFNILSLSESYDEDIDYEMSQFIKAVQKRRGTYSAKSYDGKLKVGDKVVVNSSKGLIDGVISDFDVNIMTGGETVEIEYWNEEKKSKWTMCGVPISRVKKVDEGLNESMHVGPMRLDDIIYALVKEYNMNWLTIDEHPEIAKFLPYSKIAKLDVNKTLESDKSSISLSISSDKKAVGLELTYINTDGKIKHIGWQDMSGDTLQNLTICLRKILNDVEVKIEKEYTKHPNANDLEYAIRDYVRRQTPRNFYLRNIVVGVKTRELTPDDKREGFTCIVDVEICPRDPQSRLSIGIDKNNCLRWTSQFAYHCQDGLSTPQHLIKWEQVEGKVATLLNSY